MENKPYFSIKSMEDVMNMLKYSIHRFVRKEKEGLSENEGCRLFVSNSANVGRPTSKGMLHTGTNVGYHEKNRHVRTRRHPEHSENFPTTPEKEQQQKQQRSIETKRKNNEEEKERNEDNNIEILQPSQNIDYQNATINQGPNYGPVFASYLERRREAMHDFTDRVPGKHLHTFPSSGNAGLYGFTYLGDQRVWRRDDLIGNEFAKMVDVHECIHTPDEYETRRITEWMMERERSRYIK